MFLINELNLPQTSRCFVISVLFAFFNLFITIALVIQTPLVLEANDCVHTPNVVLVRKLTSQTPSTPANLGMSKKQFLFTKSIYCRSEK